MKGADACARVAGLVAWAALAASAGCGTRALTANTTGGGRHRRQPRTRRRRRVPTDPRRRHPVHDRQHVRGVLVQAQPAERNFPTFITTLQSLTGGLPNLHLAVITSDMGAGDGSIAGCNADGGDAGIFQYTARGTCTATNLDRRRHVHLRRRRRQELHRQPRRRVHVHRRRGRTVAAASSSRSRRWPARSAPTAGPRRPRTRASCARTPCCSSCCSPTRTIARCRRGATCSTRRATRTSPRRSVRVANFRCNEFGHLCNGVKPPRLAPTGSVNDVVTLDGCVSAEGAGMLTPVATLVAQIRSLKPIPGPADPGRGHRRRRARRTPSNGGTRASPTPGHGR